MAVIGFGRTVHEPQIQPPRPIVSASIYTRDTNREFSPMCDMDTDVDSSRKLRRAPIDTFDR